MWATTRVACHLFHAGGNLFRDYSTHRIRFVVDFVPAKAHHFDEKNLAQAVAANVHQSLILTFGGEAHSAIWLMLDIARFFEPFYNSSDSRSRNADTFRQRRRCNVWVIRLIMHKA